MRPKTSVNWSQINTGELWAFRRITSLSAHLTRCQIKGTRLSPAEFELYKRRNQEIAIEHLLSLPFPFRKLEVTQYHKQLNSCIYSPNARTLISQVYRTTTDKSPLAPLPLATDSINEFKSSPMELSIEFPFPLKCGARATKNNSRRRDKKSMALRVHLLTDWHPIPRV